MDSGQAAEIPVLGSQFREAHTHLLGSRLLFLRVRNKPVRRASGSLTALEAVDIFVSDQCVSGPGLARSYPARYSCARSRRASRIGAGKTSLRTTSSSRTTLVQFGLKAFASRLVAALFASHAIGANATSASPAKTPWASDPAGKDVAAR